MQDLTPGQSIAQRFVLVRQLAGEARLQIWLASIDGGPSQALLRFFPGLNLSDLSAEIKSEIARAERLVHPSICRCLGLFEHDGAPLLAHECTADGTAWAARDYQQALTALLPVARGLAYLHDLRLAHGGVSEQFLRQTGSGELVLDGLGVAWIEARELGPSRADISAFGDMLSRLTGAGDGTPLPSGLTGLLRAMRSDSAEVKDMHEVVRRLARVLDVEDKEEVRAAPVRGAAGGSVLPVARGKQSASPAGPATHRSAAPKRAGIPMTVALPALLILLLGAVYVMFFMPRPVVQQPVVAEAGGVPAERTGPANSGSAETSDVAAPFAAAESARLRQDAQAAAMGLLRSLVTLEERGVELWAPEDFAAARLAGDEGDVLYREQDFDAALARYREGLQLSERLIGQSGEVLQTSLAEGDAAIAAGDGALAKQQFDLALAIDGENPQAIAGVARAEKLGEVLAKMRLGNAAEQAGDYSAAREYFQAAVALDNNYAAAGAALRRVQARLGARSFQDLMSRGFRALDAGDIEAARGRFSQAAKLRPDAAGPRDALAQVDARVRDADIATRRAAAVEAERTEDWGGAVAAYRAVLQTDGTLVFAREGLARAEQRASLAERMRRYIEDPLRMFDNQAYNEARGLLAQARTVTDPGPAHARQIDDLAAHVAAARQPVVVELRSDGLTKISIYKIGEIGPFRQQSVGLIPGRYTAVGSRQGYRDVRREFEVRAGKPPAPVTIICEDPV